MTTTAESTKAALRTKLVGYTFKLLLVAIPALITGWFSYRSAVVEAKTKLEASKDTAEAGYGTLRSAIEKLLANQKELLKGQDEQNKQIQEQAAKLLQCESSVTELSKKVRLAAAPVPVFKQVVSAPAKPKMMFEPGPLPETMEKAHMMQQRMR